jgi:hypothetical protein
VDQYDVVFPLNFGVPAALPANRAIAEAALTVSRKRNIPIFFAPKDIFDFTGYDNHVSSDFAGYVSTVKQVRALAATAKEKRWRRVLAIAAPPHHWRALSDLRAAGFIAEVERSVLSYPPQFWYSAESTHRHTTSWFRWWFTWEIPARFMILACRRCYEKRAAR